MIISMVNARKRFFFHPPTLDIELVSLQQCHLCILQSSRKKSENCAAAILLNEYVLAKHVLATHGVRHVQKQFQAILFQTLFAVLPFLLDLGWLLACFPRFFDIQNATKIEETVVYVIIFQTMISRGLVNFRI